MTNIDPVVLNKELKQLIISECDKEEDFSVDDITDEEPLFGSEAKLALDSLDALQISMAILKKYNVRIEGGKDGRVAYASINSLVEFICNKLHSS